MANYETFFSRDLFTLERMWLLKSKQQPKLLHGILKKRDEKPPNVTCFGLMLRRPEPLHHAYHVAFCAEATIREIPAHKWYEDEWDDQENIETPVSQFVPLQDYKVPLQESKIEHEMPIYVALHIPPTSRPLQLSKASK